MPPPIAESYVSLFRTWIEQQLPNPVISPMSALSCGLVFSAGMLLVFSSVRLARSVIGIAGCTAGAAGGAIVGGSIGVSPLLCSALGGLAVGWLVWTTDRFWLIVATAAIVLSTGIVAQTDVQSLAQLSAGPAAEASEELTKAALSGQPAAGIEQLAREWLSAAGQRVMTLVKAQSWRGLIVPGVAAILAVLVALRSARMLAGLWIALAGAALVTGSALVLIGGIWPAVRVEAVANPIVLGGITAGLWLTGIITQVTKWMRSKRAAARAAAGAAA